MIPQQNIHQTFHNTTHNMSFTGLLLGKQGGPFRYAPSIAPSSKQNHLSRGILERSNVETNPIRSINISTHEDMKTFHEQILPLKVNDVIEALPTYHFISAKRIMCPVVEKKVYFQEDNVGCDDDFWINMKRPVEQDPLDVGGIYIDDSHPVFEKYIHIAVGMLMHATACTPDYVRQRTHAILQRQRHFHSMSTSTMQVYHNDGSPYPQSWPPCEIPVFHLEKTIIIVDSPHHLQKWEDAFIAAKKLLGISICYCAHDTEECALDLIHLELRTSLSEQIVIRDDTMYERLVSGLILCIDHSVIASQLRSRSTPLASRVVLTCTNSCGLSSMLSAPRVGSFASSFTMGACMEHHQVTLPLFCVGNTLLSTKEKEQLYEDDLFRCNRIEILMLPSRARFRLIQTLTKDAFQERCTDMLHKTMDMNLIAAKERVSSLVQLDFDNEKCPICMESISSIVILPCSHWSCATCTEHWMKSTSSASISCPLRCGTFESMFVHGDTPPSIEMDDCTWIEDEFTDAPPDICGPFMPSIEFSRTLNVARYICLHHMDTMHALIWMTRAVVQDTLLKPNRIGLYIPSTMQGRTREWMKQDTIVQVQHDDTPKVFYSCSIDYLKRAHIIITAVPIVSHKADLVCSLQYFFDQKVKIIDISSTNEDMELFLA